MTTTTPELESLLDFVDGDFDQVAEMMQDFNMKEPLAGPESKRQRREGANIRRTGDEDEDEPRSDGPRKGEILQADKDIIEEMSGNSNPRQTEQLKISAGPIPVQIKYFVNLTFLNCQYADLESLPPEIKELSQLQRLYGGVNKLTELPEEIGELKQLRVLNFPFNKLTSLPAEIGQLSQLQKLILVDNELTSLPPQIGQLSQLQVLNCGKNKLASLPPEIGLLSQLQELDCSFNELTSLPPEIGQLTNLTSFKCTYNPFVKLPLSLARLSKINNSIFFLKSTDDQKKIEVTRQMLQPIYQQEEQKYFAPFYQLLGNAEKEAKEMGRQIVENVYSIIYKQLLGDFDNKYVVYKLEDEDEDEKKTYNLVVED